MASTPSKRHQASIRNQQKPTTTAAVVNDETFSPAKPSATASALSQTLASTAHLSNLLPTGTLLVFNLLTPIFTLNGDCDAVTRHLTAALLILLAASCFFACFTDSFRSGDGGVHYGLATPRGFCLFDTWSPSSPPPPPPCDLIKYRLTVIDVVHAAMSVMVFVSVALRDRNVVRCFWGERPGRETKEVLDIVPLAVGVVCSLLFVAFPTRRHGVGFPVTDLDVDHRD